ncbi:Ig-like domain-containing protein, partial [Halomonas sp. V046]|uniref:Ig-like domain-containing protein n=1 Tax=Halomonas sp. V046 TaxID=3459611 RepID=UPI0040450787
MTKGIDLNAAVLATLANDCNCTVTATVKLDEDGLPGGIPGGNGDAPGTAVTATGNLGYSFGNNGPASSGAFTWKLDDAPSLTSAGEDVTFTLSNDGRTAIGTTGNGDTVLTLVLTDVASGSYKITLSKPLDHPISGTEDDLVFSFDYAIADSQGGEAQARMVVVVDDDTPESSVIFPTSIQDGDSISGSWSVDGGADGVASTVVSLPGNTNQYPLNTPIDTGLGTLIVRDNGTWSFNVDDDLDTSQDPKLIFDIVTTDGDGDTVHSNVCIPIVDGGDGVPTTPETDGDPATVAPTATVDEDGLPGGIAGGNGDVPGQATSVSGTIGYDFGDDGPAASNAFRWSTDGLPALTSKGQDISYSLSGNGRSIVGFNDDGDRVLSIQLTDVAKGTYKVAIAQPLDHSDPTTEDDIRFSVGYTITDSDGDSADGKLNVVIDDDTPVAASDFATTDSDTPVTVDVLDNDQLGADGGSLTNASVQGGSNVGTVTTQPNGTVTFTPHPNFSGNAVITYTVTDGDGDPVTGKLKVKVEDGGDVPTTPETDGDPTTKSPTATVDEDGLPGGIAGGDGDVPGEATSVTGSLGYDFGDDGPGGFSWSTNGLPSLTSQGESLDYFLSNNGHTLTAFDEGFAPVFSVKLTNQASGAYRVTLFQPLDHSDPTTEDDIRFSVGYTITDSDGDSADGKLNMRVDDDTPVAASDFATTDSDTPVTVDVLDNDQLGADGGSLTNASVQGGSNVGTVTTQPNGTVTFTPHPNFSGNALITYTVTDGDGDPVTGKLKVKVEDGGDVPTTPETDGDPTTKSPTATVDEDGLPGGIAGGDGDVPGEATSVTGSLGYDFGNDGPGGFSWSTNGLPSLTSQGESLDYFLSNNGHTLTAFDEGFA